MRMITLGCAAALCRLRLGRRLCFRRRGAGRLDRRVQFDEAALTPGSEDAGARSAKSIECSQKADAQNLHGKPRKHFMHECKHGA